jgi:hypothetical protein
MRGPLEWHQLPTKFNEIYNSVQKLLVGDTQTESGDLIFLENRLALVREA